MSSLGAQIHAVPSKLRFIYYQIKGIYVIITRSLFPQVQIPKLPMSQSLGKEMIWETLLKERLLISPFKIKILKDF